MSKQAFNAGGKDVSESLRPVKESVVSLLQLPVENGEVDEQVWVKEEEKLRKVEQENNQDQLSGSDKYPAPSTPQLKQGERSLDNRDCHDQTNFSAEPAESGEQDGECKSVDTTAGNSVSESSPRSSPPPVEAAIKGEQYELSMSGCMTRTNASPCSGDNKDKNDESNRTSAQRGGDSCGTKASKKKTKVSLS